MYHAQFDPKRRGFLRSLVAGSTLMPGMIQQLVAADAGTKKSGSINTAIDPLAPRAPHFKPKAKRVIFLYFSGGVSHIDTWDPKPRLFADHGKQISIDNPRGKALNAYTSGRLKRPLFGSEYPSAYLLPACWRSQATGPSLRKNRRPIARM